MKKIAVEFKGVTVSYFKSRGIMGVIAAVLHCPSLFSWKFIRKILEWWNPRKKIVLKDVDFQFYAGEITGLIGSNGGGKSTAFKLITGEFPPDKGELLVFSEKAGSPSLQGRVYGVGPDPELFPEYSGMVNAQSTGLWHRIGTEDMRGQMLSLQDVVGISEHDMDSVADSLSSGNRMKMSTARALAIVDSLSHGEKGQVLLIDEPTSFLDIDSAEKVLLAVRQLMSKRADLTVIISTNNEKDLSVCDRLVCIEDGSLVEHADVLENIQAGLKQYESSVLKPVKGLLTKSVDKAKVKSTVAKPKKGRSRNYKGNPILWRSWQESRANIGLSFTLLLSLFVYNWMYLGSHGPTMPNVVLVAFGMLLSTMNRAAFRIFDMERGYFMNSRSLILSPYTRLQHATMHFVNGIFHNLVYSLLVFFILILFYWDALTPQLTLRVDQFKVLEVMAHLLATVCFVYGVGLFFSPLNMMMRSNNTFFLTYIIPILTISTSGYYGQTKNLPPLLQFVGEINPLTHLSKAITTASGQVQWENLVASSWVGIATLFVGYFAYYFGFKAAVIAKRVR